MIKKAIKSSQDEKRYKNLNHYFDFIKEIKSKSKYVQIRINLNKFKEKK